MVLCCYPFHSRFWAAPGPVGTNEGVYRCSPQPVYNHAACFKCDHRPGAVRIGVHWGWDLCGETGTYGGRRGGQDQGAASRSMGGGERSLADWGGTGGPG